MSREAGSHHCGAATGGVVTKMSTGAGAAAAACGGHGAFRRGIRADEVLRRGIRRNQVMRAPAPIMSRTGRWRRAPPAPS